MVEAEEESRQQLKPYSGRRIEVEGTISQLGSLYDPKVRREMPTICMNNLEVRDKDHPVINHVWVTWAVLMVNAGVKVGDTMRFTAQVYSYHKKDPDDHNKSTMRWGLREPRDFKCLNRDLPARVEANGVSIPIPTGSSPRNEDFSDLFEEHEALSLEIPPPTVPAPAPKDPKRELLDDLWSLVDRFGMDRVRKTLSAIETLNGE